MILCVYVCSIVITRISEAGEVRKNKSCLPRGIIKGLITSQDNLDKTTSANFLISTNGVSSSM